MMKIVLTGLIIEGIAGREGSCFGRGGGGTILKLVNIFLVRNMRGAKF